MIHWGVVSSKAVSGRLDAQEATALRYITIGKNLVITWMAKKGTPVPDHSRKPGYRRNPFKG